MTADEIAAASKSRRKIDLNYGRRDLRFFCAKAKKSARL